MENSNLKSIVAWTIFGFICVLLVQFTEQTLIYLIRLVCGLLRFNSPIAFFLELLPKFIIIVGWLYLYLAVLTNVNIHSIPEKFPTRIAVTVSITTGILLIISIALRVINSLLGFYGLPKDSVLYIEIKFNISASLNAIEMLIVILGFLRIIRQLKTREKELG